MADRYVALMYRFSPICQAVCLLPHSEVDAKKREALKKDGFVLDMRDVTCIFFKF